MKLGRYTDLLSSISELLGQARRQSARAVNAILTATYWEIGRMIVEFEQHGEKKAVYGKQVIDMLAKDLTARFGRGFGRRNLFQIRAFFLAWNRDGIRQAMSGNSKIVQTLSAQSGETGSRKAQIPSALFPTVSGISRTLTAKSEIFPISSHRITIADLAAAFPLPWSHYVRLLSIEKPNARTFYETEAIRGGWSVRQLDRQISTQFYERTMLSRNKPSMLKKGRQSQPGDELTAEEEIKDPYVLEFLGLKDEYSEHEFEEALIVHLEHFLLELGRDFAFIGRQKRLRIGNEWYRIDLLFFHRKLRCLVVIDLKVGKFTHADAGQMHMYLNYAREHWTDESENPPVGLILCAEHDYAVAKYALEGLPNKVVASQYKLALPNEKRLVKEIQQTRKVLKRRQGILSYKA